MALNRLEQKIEVTSEYWYNYPGKYIDRHEVVVRFNIMPTSGFEEDVGSKTSFRILNHRRSLSVLFQLSSLHE